MSRIKAIVFVLADLWGFLVFMIMTSYAIAAVIRNEGVWPMLAGAVGILGMGWIAVAHGKAWKAYRRQVRRGKPTV